MPILSIGSAEVHCRNCTYVSGSTTLRLALRITTHRSARYPVTLASIITTRGRCGLKVPARHRRRACDQRVQILALFLLPLSQAYSWAPAVLVNELDAARIPMRAEWLRSLAAVKAVAASFSSARRMVATLNAEADARSSAVQRISERAALICALARAHPRLTLSSLCYFS